MRMRNPFSSEPGDEETNGDEQSSDPLSPPEADRADEPTPEPDETAAPSVSETRASDGPAGAETKQAEQPSSEKRSSSSGATSGTGENISAPSIGPNTVIELKPPGERLDHDKISNTDAMGRDKRREVVGGTYGPTRARVFATFATFFAVVAAVTVGFYFLAKELDQPPAENIDEAPWSAPDAPQKPPKPLQ